MKLSELAVLTGARVDGESGEIDITGAAGLDDAQSGQVTFLANPRYTPRVNTTQASAVYVSDDAPIEREIPILRAKDPYLAYTRALRLFHPEPEISPTIHPSAVIDPSAVVDENVWIGACSVIGPSSRIAAGVRIYPNVTIYENVTIGKDSIIHSGTAIRERSVIGERVVIHNNVVVGCDGFGYAKDEQRSWLKIPQTGRVVIEDDVEIGAGTTIDRASVGESRIGRGTKIDNLVQIGHSCTVGEDSLLVRAGRVSRKFAYRQSRDTRGSGRRSRSFNYRRRRGINCEERDQSRRPRRKVISGIPAFDNKEWLRSTAAYRRLGEMQTKD